jgi:DNA-binding response OmpR family regulator
VRILLIEDHQDLAANLGEYLESRGETVDFAADGLTGLHLAAVNRYDAVVLDLNLPGMDGISLCRRLRQDARRVTPILMLTARDTERDLVEGFESGADDYLTKPCSLIELHVRLKALARRATQGFETRLAVGDLSFDSQTLIVRRGNRRLELTPTGLKLLELLMRASPAVVSRAEVEHALWGDHPPDSDAALRGHIHALRAAIDGPETHKLLHTLHGVGYRLSTAAED